MGVIGSIMEERVTFFFFQLLGISFPSLPFPSLHPSSGAEPRASPGHNQGTMKPRVTFPSLAWSGRK